MLNMVCPTCGRKFSGLAQFCTRCGIELVREKNKCSRMGGKLCRNAEFDDEDIYCCYCGALTTYAKEREKDEIM